MLNDDLKLQYKSEPGKLSQGRGLSYGTAKRVMDVSVALVLLALVAPLLCLLAYLVRRDGGSAFYSQDRLGLHGRIFSIWKLRTMVPDAEVHLHNHLVANAAARAEWAHHQKLRIDPRVTTLGRFLRKYSLDELPQLWNVLVGDMSLVGPRPMFPQQRAIYPGYAYYTLRPGMTGLWQVSDRNHTSFAERARFDTRYAETISFGTDMATLLKTVNVVFRGTGC